MKKYPRVLKFLKLKQVCGEVKRIILMEESDICLDENRVRSINRAGGKIENVNKSTFEGFHRLLM